MPIIARRILGIFAALFCAAGLLFSLFFLTRIWQARSVLQSGAAQALNSSIQLLETTDQALLATTATMKGIQDNLDTMEAASLTLAQTAHDTQPLLESLATLTGETIPETITATHQSITAAQASAKLIENFLGLVSQIPFFPGEPYRPKVPLDVALGQISVAMETMRPQLAELQSSLTTAQANTDQLESDLVQIAIEIGYLQEDLIEVQPILTDYRKQVATTVEQMQNLQKTLPGWIDSLIGLLVFIFLWLGVFQGFLCIRSLVWLRQ